MNRIRKYNGIYQVLITPSYTFDAGYNLLLGNWTDPHLQGYTIREFPTLEGAMDTAFQYPQLDWYKLILFQKHIFAQLRSTIRSTLQRGKFLIDFDAHLMTPEELKNTMFDRVMMFGNRFRLCYNLNDAISFTITNPWTHNLTEIASVLHSIPDLRIKRSNSADGVIRLIGTTDLGTTYEIVLWPTLLAQYARWEKEHADFSQEHKDDMLHKMLEAQNRMDEIVAIR